MTPVKSRDKHKTSAFMTVSRDKREQILVTLKLNFTFREVKLRTLKVHHQVGTTQSFTSY